MKKKKTIINQRRDTDGGMAHRLFEFAAVVATAGLIGWPWTIVDRVQFTYTARWGFVLVIIQKYWVVVQLMRRFDWSLNTVLLTSTLVV